MLTTTGQNYWLRSSRGASEIPELGSSVCVWNLVEDDLKFKANSGD